MHTSARLGFGLAWVCPGQLSALFAISSHARPNSMAAHSTPVVEQPRRIRSVRRVARRRPACDTARLDLCRLGYSLCRSAFCQTIGHELLNSVRPMSGRTSQGSAESVTYEQKYRGQLISSVGIGLSRGKFIFRKERWRKDAKI